jgi:PQQ-dependent dehydrogenase (methanol/ethanol family)
LFQTNVLHAHEVNKNMHVRKMTTLYLSLIGLILVAFAAVAQQPSKVDDTAILNHTKTGEEWLTYGLGWFEQRYSQLNQINTSNVNRLGLAWSYDIPYASGNPTTGNREEGTPLVHNGVMYSIAAWSVVYAVDARTGKELWHQDPDVNQAVTGGRICCGVVNRGIALYEDKVIAPVVDGRLRALDAATGKVVWETRVSPINMPYSITMAPRVIKGGKIIVGVSGGEFGVRGFFDAYDANTGKQAWRFWTVPGDPSKPFEQPELKDWAKTWTGEWWKIGGGGPVWGGVAYDPDNDIVYVGTGQPGPWTSYHRGQGDNLCTDCIIAVRGATGKYLWHYQTTPGDDWDFDSIADIMLADLPINGKTRHVLMHAPKNGFFYLLDRLTGELLGADPWVTVNWASGVNLKTGRPTVNPEARYGLTGVNIMPGPGGGHVWVPWSFNPNTGLVYIPSTSGAGYNFQANPDYVPISTDIGPEGTGRGVMGNMATGAGRGGAAAAGGGRGGAAGLAPGIDATAAGVGPANAGRGAAPGAAAGAGRGAAAGGGRGGAGAGAPGGAPAPAQSAATPQTIGCGTPPPPAGAAPAGRGGGGGGGRGQAGPVLPTIGPEGGGNPLIAWDPVAQKERWRVGGGAAGYNQGGTLSTAGNLVFGVATTANGQSQHLMAYRADTGERVGDIQTCLTQMGPPTTFQLDGKQYLAISGSTMLTGGGGGGGRGAGGAPAGPPLALPRGRMLVFTIGGTLPLPGLAPAN